MTCPICNGSGERDGEYGLLSCDAPNCTAATERAALEAANKAAEPMTVYDQRWFAYQAGVKAAMESKKPRPWQKLWDSQWVNIVNHEHAYSGWSVEDAVHHAVELTEKRLKLNNTEPE